MTENFNQDDNFLTPEAKDPYNLVSSGRVKKITDMRFKEGEVSIHRTGTKIRIEIELDPTSKNKKKKDA